MGDLKDRTQKFALTAIRFCAGLPHNRLEYEVVAKQLIRSATSVGANYRSACRGKSRADFFCKLSIVEEEADECVYWMELLESLSMTEDEKLVQLKDEANQIKYTR
jgi:four helix bundle protein